MDLGHCNTCQLAQADSGLRRSGLIVLGLTFAAGLGAVWLWGAMGAR